MGSVTPLLAVFQAIQKLRPETQFLWLATKDGPESELVATYGIQVIKISAGKLRRYFSFRNFTDPFRVLAGFFQARKILKEYAPNAVVTAGGFVGVPVAWAAARLRIPIVAHQPDFEVGLANKMIANVANIITVSFEATRSFFPKDKTVLTGNPVRQDILGGDRAAVLSRLELDAKLPTVLVMGGSTGSKVINDLLLQALPKLVEFCQVIHLTGGRAESNARHPRYKAIEFAGPELRDFYAAADLVVSRAGVATLSELTALKKPAILIPMPNSPQEANAEVYFHANAALLVKEENITPAGFTDALRELLEDELHRQSLSRQIGTLMPVDAADKIAKMIL